MTIHEHISLASYNTFHLPVRAAVVAEYASPTELKDLLQTYRHQPVLPIGEGSNLLFTKDFEGVLLCSRMQRARALKETEEEVWIEAESGLKLDDLIAQTADMNLRGLENLSHIPGTVGASVVQNVGAYGVEAQDVVETVTVLDRESMTELTLSAADCRFAYRYSRFKDEWKERYIVMRVTYRLYKSGHLNLRYQGLQQALSDSDELMLTPNNVRQAIIRIRAQKLPEVTEFGSAGSFFKNPVVPASHFAALQEQYPDIPHYPASDGVKVPAAWLIERSGCKAMEEGGAAVWQKQPLVIINTGKATSQDIIALADKIRQTVQQQFHILLQAEVQYV